MNTIPIKQSLRYLSRNKIYSSVTILGLSISLTLVLLMTIFISTEMQVDGFHNDKIYRVVRANECAFSPPFGQYLIDNIDGLESFCRVFAIEATLKSEHNLLRSYNCYYADSDFFNMFSFDLTSGNSEEVLAASNNVAISESYAKKLFPNETAMGKIIRLNNRLDYIVSGVFKDFNQKTHFKPADVIFPFDAMGDYFSKDYLKQFDWRSFLPALYVKAKQRSDLSEVGNEIYNKAKSWYWLFQEDESSNVELQPIDEIYFSSASYSFVNGVREGNPNVIRLFSFIVFGILVIASINYINLTISYSIKRREEVGLKKIIGSSRNRLVYQSLMETAFFFIIALLISALLFYISIPAFNELIGYDVSFLKALSIIKWAHFIGYFAIVLVIMSSLAALIYSGFTPLSVIHKTTIGRKAKVFQNCMVVAQYVVSISLIIAMSIIMKQNHFLLNYNVGFNKEETFFIPLNSEIKKQKLVFKEELEKISGVESVSLCNGMPGVGISNIRFEVNNSTHNIDVLNVDENYFQTLGISLQNSILPGNDICWITESAARTLEYNESMKTVEIEVYGKKKIYLVNEVLPDMNYHSLYKKTHPAVFTKLNADGWVDYILLRVNTSDIEQVIIDSKNTYKAFCSNFPFDYFFLNERINRAYEKESRTLKIVVWFSFFAIFISSMGTLTLAVLSGNQRIKEIGVRKVNGAIISEILILLNKDFIKWVLIAFVIATPIAYYVMSKWLENFAYKTELSWWIFALAGLSALGIALLTVSWQSWRAATRNPVEALRYE